MSIPLYLQSSHVPGNTAGGTLPVYKDGYFTLSGDGIFHTIQGEGITAGIPATFIRLHGCNLACSWCDTWYTWRKDRTEYYEEPTTIPLEDLAQAIEEVHQPIQRIVFTGGEPLMQQESIAAFLTLHPELTVEIETNGTIMPLDTLLPRVQWNCSPKTRNSGNTIAQVKKPDVLQAIALQDSCFKFVCRTAEDVQEVLDEYGFLPREKMMIMPEGVTVQQNATAYAEIVEAVLKHDLRISPRLQNILFDGAKRRV